MRLCKQLFITLLISGLSSHVMAEKLRVIDKGQDGHKRYYSVTCPDGNRSSVNAEFTPFEEPVDSNGQPLKGYTRSASTSKPSELIQICMSSHSGEYKCDANWSIDEAAIASCP